MAAPRTWWQYVRPRTDLLSLESPTVEPLSGRVLKTAAIRYFRKRALKHHELWETHGGVPRAALIQANIRRRFQPSRPSTLIMLAILGNNEDSSPKSCRAFATKDILHTMVTSGFRPHRQKRAPRSANSIITWRGKRSTCTPTGTCHRAGLFEVACSATPRCSETSAREMGSLTERRGPSKTRRHNAL